MQLLDFLVAGLATWRITHLLIYENGPFRVFRKLRERLGVVYYEDGDDVLSHKYEITTCVWCLSVWVGAMVAGLWFVAGSFALWPVMPFALSAIAVILHELRTGALR